MPDSVKAKVSESPSPSPLKRGLLLAFLLLATLTFLALGVWQVERRAWKLTLIEAVQQRVHSAPGRVPAPAEWAGITEAKDAYRHVSVRGRLLHEKETLVQALTEQGSGYWVMTPLRSDEGSIILVNRGFVPSERSDGASRLSSRTPDEVVIRGLLRITEPSGRILRKNQPDQERWYSRDVQAIAHARQLQSVAPYFIDADATPNPGGVPVGGLTVISFPNNHLVYALTWFGLAALSIAGLVLVLRQSRTAPLS
jgi:surfeit locus 1 family protein